VFSFGRVGKTRVETSLLTMPEPLTMFEVASLLEAICCTDSLSLRADKMSSFEFWERLFGDWLKLWRCRAFLNYLLVNLFSILVRASKFCCLMGAKVLNSCVS